MLVVRAPGPHLRPSGPVCPSRWCPHPEAAMAECALIEGFPMPDGAPGSLLPTALLDSEVLVRLGRVDGEVAGATRGYVGHGVVNLCGAATLPIALGGGECGRPRRGPVSMTRPPCPRSSSRATTAARASCGWGSCPSPAARSGCGPDESPGRHRARSPEPFPCCVRDLPTA